MIILDTPPFTILASGTHQIYYLFYLKYTSYRGVIPKPYSEACFRNSHGHRTVSSASVFLDRPGLCFLNCASASHDSSEANHSRPNCHLPYPSSLLLIIPEPRFQTWALVTSSTGWSYEFRDVLSMNSARGSTT